MPRVALNQLTPDFSLADYRGDRFTLADLRGRKNVLGPEDARAFAEYFRKESLPFIGLPDPRASALRLYGQEVTLCKLGRMPAQVFVDKARIARFVHYGHDMRDIPTWAENITHQA
jgi:hypothetical protein